MPFTINSKKVLPSIPSSAINNVVANLQQGNQAGLCVGEAHVTMDVYNSGSVTVNDTTNDVRIIAPRFFPSLGGIGNTRAISQSLDMLYNAVVGSAYDTTNFSRADLGKHLFICEGFVLGMDMIDRYLDTFAIRQYGNIAPDALLKAQRFSKYHGSDLTPYLELQAIRNQLVPLFDKLLIPSSIAWINKHRTLVRHVFADDVHTKTQLIVPIPELLYWNLDSNGDVTLASASLWNANASSVDLDVMVFAAGLVTAVQNYLDSAWFKDLSPYLWRAMCQENGPKIDKIISFSERLDKVPSLQCEFIFDYSVIQLIRNADYVGRLANMVANKTTTTADYGVKIYEDNEGNLRQGKYAYGTGATDSTYGIVLCPLFTLFNVSYSGPEFDSSDKLGSVDLINSTNIKAMVHPGAINKKYINAEGYPSSDETLYYVMNASVNFGYFGKPGSTSNRLIGIMSSGDTVFTLINVVYNTHDYAYYYMDEIYPLVAEGLISGIDADGSYTACVATTIICQDYVREQHLALLGTLEGLNSCPIFTKLIYDSGDEFQIKTVYVDKDNLVFVPQQALVTIHQFISYHSMDILNVTRSQSDPGSFKGQKHGRHNKSSSKKAGKDKEAGDAPKK